MKKNIAAVAGSLFLLLTTFSYAQGNSATDPNDKNYTGEITKEDLLSGSNASWFKRVYDSYEPSAEIIEALKDHKLKKFSIKAFMGTWCPDSRSIIPQLYKLLDEAGFKEKNLTIYTMDRKKTTEANYEEGLAVERVPTVIFYKKNKEINRFVEFPQETFEEDILSIVKGEDYKHSYLD